MKKTTHKHLFPIINAMVDHAIAEVEEGGETVSCKAGCTHCCHLLIEISAEEAYELVEWTTQQLPPKRDAIIERVQAAAASTREVFNRREESRKFSEPLSESIEIPDDAFDEYFYEKKRPCPFLENDHCIAYESRPTPCRLHLVTSDPNLCSKDVGDEDDYEVPEEFETLREAATPVIEAVELDGRWAQFAIMVEAIMKEQGLIPSEDVAVSSEPKIEAA